VLGGVEEDRRRAPEKSVLLEAFRRGWASVSGMVPTRVKREVTRYFESGQLRSGFVEVTCGTCAASAVVAFSCKGRSWCPSCTARRAAEAGLHLAAVLPTVAHRQWTLSLPFSLRLAVVKRPWLLKRLEVRLVKAIWRWQRGTARHLGSDTGGLKGGAVCFTQSPSLCESSMPRGASGELAAAVVYSKLPNEGLRVDPPHRERAPTSVFDGPRARRFALYSS